MSTQFDDNVWGAILIDSQNHFGLDNFMYFDALCFGCVFGNVVYRYFLDRKEKSLQTYLS